MLSVLRRCVSNRVTGQVWNEISHCGLQPISVRYATTYRAAILEEFNKKLKIENVTNRNELSKQSVKIGVKYCCLNTTDVQYMSGHEDSLLPMIPGCEVSGEVLEVGPQAKQDFKVGDKVVSFQSIRRLGGGLADQCIVHEDECFNVGGVSLKNAAVLVQGHATALLAFTKYCQLNENDNVIVIAGPGGNGLAAIQLANSVFKAKVYAICDSEDTSALIRDEGAYKSIGINEGLSKVYKYLETNLKDNKAKLVYDAVGNGLLYVAADFVDPVAGCFLTADPFYSAETFPNTKPEFKKTSSKKKETKPPTENSDEFVSKIQHLDLGEYRVLDLNFYRQTIQDTLSLCEEEIITPYISQTFPLRHINKAVKFIKEKKCTGKVLIDLKASEDNDSDVDTDAEDNDDDDEKKNTGKAAK